MIFHLLGEPHFSIGNFYFSCEIFGLICSTVLIDHARQHGREYHYFKQYYSKAFATPNNLNPLLPLARST